MIPEGDFTLEQAKTAMLTTVVTAYCKSCKLTAPWTMNPYPSAQFPFATRPADVVICPNCRIHMIFTRPGDEFYWTWERDKWVRTDSRI